MATLVRLGHIQTYQAGIPRRTALLATEARQALVLGNGSMNKAWYDIGGWCEPEPANQPMSMSIEAPEAFDHPIGFVRLRERHRVKVVSRRIVESHS